jgi:hypothetical protein
MTAPVGPVDSGQSSLGADTLKASDTERTKPPLIQAASTVQVPEVEAGTVFTSWGRAIGVLPADNKPFLDFLQQIYDIHNLPKEQRQEYILKNVELVRSTAESVIEKGKENFNNGKPEWAGVTKSSGIPMSTQLEDLTGGYSPQFHYSHNCLGYHMAKAVKEGLKLFESEDCDGTFVDKTLRTFATRRFQSLRQIYEHFQAINASTELLDTTWTVNTARSLFSTQILARNEGIEGSTTMGEHYSAFSEIAGTSPADQIDLANRMGVSAFNGAVRHEPSKAGEKPKPLYISPKLMQVDYMFRFLGDDFLDKFFIKPTLEHEYSAAEPKGLTDYIFQTQKILGEVYYTDYLKIAQAYEDTVQVGKSWDDFQVEIKRLIKDEDLKIIGSTPLDETTQNRMIGSKIPNYYDLLENSPQEFFFTVTNSRITSICCHFFNSRGVPKEGSIDDAKDKLIDWSHHEGVRNRTRELNRGCMHTQPEIRKYVEENQRILREDGVKAYIDKRLLDHMMHLYKKDDFKNSKVFDIVFDEIEHSHKLTFKKEFLESLNSYDHTRNYVYELKEKLQDGTAPERELAKYLDDIFPVDILDRSLLSDTYDLDPSSKTDGLYLFPDELFCVNNKNQFTGHDSFISIFNLEAKSNALNPDGNYYFELQPNTSKGEVIPSPRRCFEEGLFPIHHGDTLSDLDAQIACLERGGLAIVPYTLIKDGNIYEAAFKAREKYATVVEESINIVTSGFHVTKRQIPTFDVDQGRMLSDEELALQDWNERLANVDSALTNVKQLFANGAYGIEKNKETENYKKVIITEDGNKDYVRDESGNILEFTKDEIITDIKRFYLGRVVRMPNPSAKVRCHSEIIQLLTGVNLTLDENSEFATKAIERDRYISSHIPKSRAWFIYRDDHNEAFYRRKEDGCLVSLKTGKVLTYGVENVLKRREKIAEGHILNKCVGEKIDGIDQEVTIDFLNKILQEDKHLPAVSQKSGLFSNNLILNCFGLGDKKKGEERLDDLLCRLPRVFPKVLEWSGGMMALGGVIRLISIPFVGEESIVNKTGYWVSNLVRAASALAGGLRGELNVNKYHDIFGGELINVFSALFLGNGAKHAGLGLGNLLLFGGRGRQRAQIMQRVNSHTLSDIKSGKLESLDPREYTRDVTKFAAEDLIVNITNAAKRAKCPVLLAEVGATLFSSLLTPGKIVYDVIREPKLIFSWTKRESEKSGKVYSTIPSAGHLLSITGLISGIGAIIAGTLGRSEKAGDIADHGFNFLGDWAIKISSAIPALSIIVNGWEVANNAQGLPLSTRNLDGTEMKYNPKRAGFAQMAAGGLYGILPWFGLHKDSVAAAYDVANGLYFGLPGMNMSVAEEEKLNTLKMVEDERTKGQKLFLNQHETLAEIASRAVAPVQAA